MGNERLVEFEVNGKAYFADVYNNGWAWYAVEQNYDGPEDRWRLATGDTPEEALENLIEKLEELDEREASKTKSL